MFDRIAAFVIRHARSGAVVSGSMGFVIVASFARGVLLARMLGPTDYGLAVILITIGAGLDLLTDGGVDQYVVRSRFGYRRDILAAAQAWRLISSLIAACVVVALALPMAIVVNAPELAPAIAALALPTTLRGFVNLAIKVQQREHRFDKEAAVDVIRSAAEFATLLAAALLLRSHWAVVAGLTANALAQVVASIALSDGRPAISPGKRPRRLIARFSLPVTWNAAILFLATQADRLVIAHALEPAKLALYAAACAIGQAAATLLSRIISRLFLPIFGAATVGLPAKRRQADRLTLAALAGSFTVAVGLALAVPPLVPLIYGPGFADVRLIVLVSAALQMVQIEQAWLTTLMVGAGATHRFPLITGVRAASLPLILPLLWRLQDMLLVPFALLVGATASLAISYATLARLAVVSPRIAVVALARSAAAIVVVAILIF